MSFPNILDGAKVLFFTPQERYGTVHDTMGEIVDHVCYLAICKYENENTCYLFGCNANYEVVSDSLWSSVKECMCAAENSYNCAILWIAAL